MLLLISLICITSQLFVIEGIDITQYFIPPKEFTDKNPTKFELYGTESEQKNASSNV